MKPIGMIVRIKKIEDITRHIEGCNNKRLSFYKGNGNSKVRVPTEDIKLMNLKELKKIINDEGLTLRKTRS